MVCLLKLLLVVRAQGEFSVQLYAEKVAARGLCAIAQCESLRYKLIGGLAVRRLTNTTNTHTIPSIRLRFCSQSLNH